MGFADGAGVLGGGGGGQSRRQRLAGQCMAWPEVVGFVDAPGRVGAGDVASVS